MGRIKVYQPDDWLDQDDWLAQHYGIKLKEVSDDHIKTAMVDLVVKCLESPIFCIRNYFFTVDKDTGTLVHYEPWVGQTQFDYVREYQKACDLPQRIVEIKARQVGFTQHNINLGIHNCFFPNRKSVIMMPDQDVLDENSPRIGAVINNLPPWLTLMRRIENKNQWVFENPESRERMHDPGQSSTLTLAIPSSYRGAPGVNYVCFSEFAHYDNAFTIMEAVMGGIGKSSGTCVTIDTTPFHHDPVYEPMVRRAIARNPNWAKMWEKPGGFTRQDIITGRIGVPDHPKGWVPVFIAWWQHEQYTTKDESPFGQLPKLTRAELNSLLNGPDGERIGTNERYGGDEELWLMKTFGISIHRIAWRRFAIDDVEASDWRYKLLTFHQEYATRWHDCFVDYGLTPFDPIGLEVVRTQIRPSPARGILREERDEYGDLKIGVDTSFVSEFQEVRVWATPVDGEQYIIGVDPSYAWESEDSDWTVAQVLRRRDEKQVAIYDCHVPPHVAVEQIYLLYKWYNRALTAIETEDGTGYSYCRLLWDMGLTNQYRWKRLDEDSPTQTKWLGWQSDNKTKPVMYSTIVKSISDLSAWSQLPLSIRDKTSPPICIRDEKTYYEIAGCKRRANGNIEAAGKGHDDTFVAWCIAQCVNRDLDYGTPLPSLSEQRGEVNAYFMEKGFGGKDDRYVETPSRA